MIQAMFPNGRMEKLWCKPRVRVIGMDNMTTEGIKDILLRALDEIDRMESAKEEFEKLRQGEREAMEREVANYRAQVAEKDALIAETDARIADFEKELAKDKK